MKFSPYVLETAWFLRDPILHVKRLLESSGLASEMEIKEIDIEAKKLVETAEKESAVRSMAWLLRNVCDSRLPPFLLRIGFTAMSM